MFLHSGASLHGHEYSKRDRTTPATGHAAPRRNPLLRSSFGTPLSRPSPSVESPSTSPSAGTTGRTLKRLRPVSDHGYAYTQSPTTTPESVVRFLEPKDGLVPATKADAMSEDEASSIVDVSDSDISRAASSTRQRGRRSTKKCTSYLLAQAPPSLGKKQRFLHIRPKLLLQLQQLSADQRPRPTVDVYTSLGIANTSIAAHLCKRFPRLARIKKEVGIQDVLLVRSENYDATTFDSDSDGDEDNIKSRDLVAILSPLRGQDKAEIALPNGNVWVAAPRVNGSSLSYEFTNVDENGHVITARWVRRQVTSTSPPTTTSPTMPPTPPISTPVSPTSGPLSFPFPPSSPPLEHKFTFSIVDPDCRRHPIMATLKPSALEIQDAYTTVSQSAGRFPPTSPQLGSPESPNSENKASPVRRTRRVEEWQKEFIQISALWVALRHGWVPQFRPADFIPQSANTGTKAADARGPTHNRSRSYTTGAEPPRMSRDLTGRRRNPSPSLREEGAFSPGILPRRATSTGAAKMQRLMTQRLSEAPEGSETGSIRSKGRRVLSSDWNGSVANRHTVTSIADVVGRQPLEELSGSDQMVIKTPASKPGRRAVSEVFTTNPLHPSPLDKNHAQRQDMLTHPQPPTAGTDLPVPDGRRHHRWNRVSQWFSKLRSR
ncbi:hypothetical protein JX266_005261 [Neoarthrinium moseri]|nr:hypothetical protein JX266_005261 [Neoarthrinium moseri]